MKNFTLILVAVLFSATSVFAQADDATVAGWPVSISGWFNGIAAPDGTVKAQIFATPVTGFDALTAVFDTEWAKVPGDGNVIGKPGSRLGLAASENGAADFTGAFKVLHDASNIYILLKYTDDDITGSETIEVCVSPYLKVSTTEPNPFWFTRFTEFGAYKAVFTHDVFASAMIVNGAAGTIDWSASPTQLTDNLFIDSKSVDGTGVVKEIITIGFASMVGSARPTFDLAAWTALEGGKGISFDFKVNDVDMDDALTADAEPKAAPAEYWWNAIDNECWRSNDFAGFLAPLATGIVSFKAENNSIFQSVTLETVKLKKVANVTVYNTAGVQLISIKNASEINISNLNKGVYIIRANDQTMKFVR